MHNPHNLEHSLYKPVTIANALFIRLGEGNVIFSFFFNARFSYEGRCHPLTLSNGKHLISNLHPSCYTNEPSVLISNTLLHVFLA